MSQEDLVIHMFCLIDDHFKSLSLPPLRRSGPAPTLADSEVITIQITGELLGLDTDRGIFGFARQHLGHLFPGLRRVNRTSFIRQAANLWAVQQRLLAHLADTFLARTDPCPLWVLDSFPLPVCRFARAPSCKRFAGLANCGFDHSDNTVYYGLRVHLRCADCGVIRQLEIAPAAVHDSDLVAELLPAGSTGLGDRNYWDPLLQQQLRAEGKQLIAPFRRQSTDPWPQRSKLIFRLRQVIEPVIGQLVVRLNAKRTWARDQWHLCLRLIRKALAHTAAVVLNACLGNPPLQLELLMAT